MARSIEVSHGSKIALEQTANCCGKIPARSLTVGLVSNRAARYFVMATARLINEVMRWRQSMMQRKRLILIAFAYLSLHLVLDLIGRRYADVAQGITSWNPAAGIGIVMVCHYGRSMAALILPTTLLSSMLLKGPAELVTVAALEGLLIGSVYTLAALALRSPRLAFDSELQSVKDLMILMAVAVASSATVAASYVTNLVLIGAVSEQEALEAAFRYWVGDLIGIMIIAPFGLLALQSRLTIDATRSRLLLYSVTIVLLVVTVVYRDPGRTTYFYFLFFPVIWAALAAGIEGVVPVLALIEAGVYLAILSDRMDFLDITAFQARTIALSATGLIAGALVSERQRFETRNRRQQEALAQIAMRGSMGELGTAIAHELNQPLSAAGTFAGLVVEALTAEKLQDPTALENARKVVRQIDRASGVVRRLRALVKLARDGQAPVAPERILQEVAELMRLEASRSEIETRVDIGPGLPLILVDRLQIEQALLNLTRNAVEAIQESGMRSGTITLYARELTRGSVELGVVDTGPGFSPDFSLDRLQPFNSHKDDGLGIGLSLCQSIALANHGQLQVHKSAAGAHVAIAFDPDRRVKND